jgi:hypothetical protein
VQRARRQKLGDVGRGIADRPAEQRRGLGVMSNTPRQDRTTRTRALRPIVAKRCHSEVDMEEADMRRWIGRTIVGLTLACTVVGGTASPSAGNAEVP